MTFINTTTGISSFIQDIYEGALFSLRQMNMLVPTVTVYNDTVGMNPRKITEFGTLEVKQVAEGEATATQILDRNLLSTLTPLRYTAGAMVTDERLRTDPENIRNAIVMEMGQSFASDIDKNIASLFSGLTGGTVGSYGGTIGWSQILAAMAVLAQKNVPPPYVCVIGAGHYYHLANNAGTVETSFTRSTMFADRLINSAFQYLESPIAPGVVFVRTNNISGSQGTAGLGAMFARSAIAYDQRSPFTIEPERDASRQAWTLNANMHYATGLWRPVTGVQLRGTDVVPTS